MGYHLSNLETNQYIILSKEMWIHLLSIAISNQWKPKGTILDCGRQEVQITHFGGETITIGTAMNNSVHWTGSYTQMRKQIVTERDSKAFAAALIGANIPTEVLQFIEKGAFRIDDSDSIKDATGQYIGMTEQRTVITTSLNKRRKKDRHPNRRIPA